ncbi:hypothetical protein CC78DRAFT_618421 [Lojkania enalia]|uniref:Uncharacterized protein n=1 Tax=Lojkania enalia TaxID=147567 RepID=A0A9P4K5H7_9PLEO|nr:hypothetical protein CC78DRAFT_618421 [Didymosphaeria enalia]
MRPGAHLSVKGGWRLDQSTDRKQYGRLGGRPGWAQEAGREGCQGNAGPPVGPWDESRTGGGQRRTGGGQEVEVWRSGWGGWDPHGPVPEGKLRTLARLPIV